MDRSRGPRTVDRPADRLAHAALRLSIGSSWSGALALILVGLAASWVLTYLIGGAQRVVPHWYYLPILFTAIRFGPLAALVVALASGILAGPLTPLEVAAGTAQQTGRWLTRAGFFVVIGLSMSWLVRPSLPSITDELRRLRDERALRRAIAEGELFLRYQPIVDLRTGALHGVEALVRWQHPDQGELPPAAFLATAEASEVIHELGGYVLRRACTDAARWRELAREHGRGAPLVSVNMSAKEVVAPDLIERVRDVLVETGADPAQMCIEITESALVDDLDISVARMAGLRTLGVGLAVDDFGTGYSSLSAVHRFPIDTLKVDRSFIAALGRDPQAQPLLAGLEIFARSLALTTVAEGIETPEQVRILNELDFDLGQGYHYARPMLPEEVDTLLIAPRPGPPGRGTEAADDGQAAQLVPPPSPEQAGAEPRHRASERRDKA